MTLLIVGVICYIAGFLSFVVLYCWAVRIENRSQRVFPLRGDVTDANTAADEVAEVKVREMLASMEQPFCKHLLVVDPIIENFEDADTYTENE